MSLQLGGVHAVMLLLASTARAAAEPVPPALRRGNAMPFVGASPVTTIRFMIACRPSVQSVHHVAANAGTENPETMPVLKIMMRTNPHRQRSKR